MIVTKEDAAKAEAAARDQRLAGLKLLQVDESKAGSPAALDLAKQVHGLADTDPLKADAMLGDKKVAELFRRRALHFGGSPCP
jgi:hypothetical protein